MKFKDPPKLGFSSGVLQYLQSSFWAWCKDIVVGLRRLNFEDNFQGFQATVTIAAGAEAVIKNGFEGVLEDSIPTKRIIVRQTGNGVITDGPTPWSADYVYLTNNGAVPVTITVIFLL